MTEDEYQTIKEQIALMDNILQIIIYDRFNNEIASVSPKQVRFLGKVILLSSTLYGTYTMIPISTIGFISLQLKDN
jgi:hypothetical protein